MNKRAGRWLAVGALAVVAVAAGIYAFSRHNKLPRARHDVQVIALTLDAYAREHGEYPRGTRGEICRMLRGESVNGQNTNRLDYIDAQPSELSSDGEFLDPWGMPYRLTTDPAVRVYSCGPNRIDEAGEGDDIASWK